MRLILASSSPRRLELLRAAGFCAEPFSPDVDETPRAGEDAGDLVLRLAKDKMRSVSAAHPAAWVLAADTVVVLDGGILGKPGDEEEARHMLGALSGREHEVITGFALGHGPQEYLRAVRTRVRFRKLGEEEIAAYVQSGEPMDKAGGYGIQAGAAHMVLAIEGSYTNVVGLPMAEVVQALKEFGIPSGSNSALAGPADREYTGL